MGFSPFHHTIPFVFNFNRTDSIKNVIRYFIRSIYYVVFTIYSLLLLQQKLVFSTTIFTLERYFSSLSELAATAHQALFTYLAVFFENKYFSVFVCFLFREQCFWLARHPTCQFLLIWLLHILSSPWILLSNILNFGPAHGGYDSCRTFRASDVGLNPCHSPAGTVQCGGNGWSIGKVPSSRVLMSVAAMMLLESGIVVETTISTIHSQIIESIGSLQAEVDLTPKLYSAHANSQRSTNDRGHRKLILQ